MSEQNSRPPQSTYGFTRRIARTPHRCRDCRRWVHAGQKHVEDCYYAPYGNGDRYCLRCAGKREREWMEWEKGWEERWADLAK